MILEADLTTDLPRIDATASDDALLAAIARRDPRDRVAAHTLHARHIGALRAAVLDELAGRGIDAVDEIVCAVFLTLLFGAATAFQSARGNEALPWLEALARVTAREHARAGALDRRPLPV